MCCVQGVRMKPDVLKFIKRIKRLFVFTSLVLLVLAMVFLIWGIVGAALYFIAFALCAVGFIAALVLYLSKVKYAIVYELGFSGGVITVKVKGGTYTFSPENVKKVRYDRSKYIVYFQKDGESDHFIFLRNVPFDRFRAEQFREEEIAAFFPKLSGGAPPERK